APACVTNTAPVNGAAIATQTTATLTWNAAATATSYDVYIWAGAVAPVTPTANITGTSYNAISLIAGTLYNWYIAPKNASGAASGCATTNRTSFTTASSTPTPGAGTGLQGVYYNGITLTGTPLLTRIDPVINFDSYGSPGPGVPADQYSVRWTGQVKPLYTETYTFYTTADDGIRLWVNGTQLVNNFVAQGATERSGTIAMVAGQKYDIIIEYFEGSGGAVSRLSWSGARTPKAVVPQSQLFPPGFVDPTIPTCAANTAPANGSTIASASAATLSWNAVPDASSYDVYIWTGATPSATPTANTTNTSYNATALTASTLYNWYVVPKNVIGTPAGCISNSTTFNTGVPPPACTINLLPVNNAILATSSTAAITWTAAATATSYDVYIWTGATAPVTPTANLNAASYNAAGLTAATTYNWYVSPRNASSAAIGCSTNKTAFVTAAPPAPSCTVNTLPANGVTIATQITAALSWNPAPNATSYDVYVWTGATPPASPTANITASTYAASGLIAATSYNWYVTPKNATGTAAGCNANASRFTTAAAPPSNLLGYVKVSTDPYTACADASSTGRTAVYGSSIANGSILYTGPALTTAFNGGWNWYSFTPVPGGPVTVTFAVYPTGGILMLRTCANGGARIAAEANATTVEQDIAALKVIRETAEAAAPRRPVIAAVVTGSIMYPNPVVNGQAARLQINSDKTGVAVVNIINSNGFIISTRKVNLVAGMNAATVNTASLGKGLYIVNITGGTKPTNIKLLVE
ncbi:MAG: PA14 domain-containing protein, partial [Bacteroidota bacterium]